MPELATAWVTLAISADGMRRDITRAMSVATRGATITPRVDSAHMSAQGSAAGSHFRARFNSSARLDPRVNTPELAGQGSAAGRAFGDRFSSSAKLAMTTLGLGAGVAGLASQFKQVMSVGMDWTRTMNTFTAVTGASAAELKKAGDAARALGNDVSLPATSANDAAAAMTELAKGGFTVQQAMDAAKGSLQLAAAAGISATDAATIQSQALQAFGLDAKEAGKMSDTLANAANASSAEITDVAYALQASGTVANQFGLSAQDTAAAIALLANNGIKGSDAGTLLKSSLLALTDQGKPAQAAIKELGLTVYDAQGKFVGLHALYGQLGEAAKRMTQEDYQAATAVLFGSDAMRIAGVAAKDGSASYDRMRTAIERQGAAADVAAAKTQGLPGAWERFKNTVESLQLQAYDKLEGPLTKVIDGVSSVPDKLSELAQNPRVQSLITDTRTAFVSLADAAKRAGPGILEISKSLGSAAVAIGGAAWKAFVVTLESAAAVVKTIAPALKAIGDMMSAHQGLVTAAAAAWLAFKLVPGILGAATPALTRLNNTVTGAVGGARSFSDAYRTMATYVRQANPGMSTASVHIQAMHSAAGAAASGGLSALKGAAGGLMGALGGPWGLAITGAVTVIGLLGKAHADAAEAARQQKQAEDALRQTLSAGQVTEQTQAAVAKSLEESGASKRAVSYGIDPNDLMRAASGDTATLEALRAKARESITTGLGAYKFTGQGGAQLSGLDVMAQYQKEGVGNDTFMRAMMGNKQAVADMNKALAKSPAAMSGQLTSMEQLLDKMPDVNESIVTMMRSVEQQTGTVQNSIAAWELANRTQYGTWQATEAGVDAFKRLGATIVSTPSDKTVRVSIPPDALAEFNAKMSGIGNTTQNLPDGTVVVTANTDEAIQRWKAYLQKVATTPVAVPVEVRTPAFVPAVPGETRRPTGGGRADGAIVLGRAFGAIAMADGGLRQIRKPQSADIYSGRGAGTIFAEEETGGEAYIPLAPSKRGRSMAILAEVARRFGVGANAMADGGITVDALKQFASNIAGTGYTWGGGNGDTFDTDCSGAQSTIANFITGGSGRFATASEGSELLSRGFQTGDPPSGIAAYWVGWQNGGPGGGHTAGTIVDPDGGNVNVEMGGKNGGGQYGAGAAGASQFPNRAWIALAGGDNGKTTGGGGGGASSSQVMSAQSGVRRAKASTAKAQQDLDEANADIKSAPDDKKRKAAEKKRDNAQRRLDAAQDREATANQRLSEVLSKKSQGTEKDAKGGGDGGAQSFGQSLVSGLFQGLGLDGSLFSNPLDWPHMKSGLALLNWGAGYAKAWGNAAQDEQDGQSGDSGGGGALGGVLSGLNLPNLAPSTEPKNLQPIGAAGTGTGPLPGPAGGDTWNISGVNPKEILPKIDARQWAAANRQGVTG